ncbi:hypothetical protein EOM81_12960, partial [bacterium]|nr:hypothetical protein [bacterium]
MQSTATPEEENGDNTSYSNSSIKNPTETTYDVLNRKTYIEYPDHTGESFAYSISGGCYVTTHTDPEGKKKKIYKDIDEQIVAVEEYDDSGTAQRTTYDYDIMKQITSVKDAAGN